MSSKLRFVVPILISAVIFIGAYFYVISSNDSQLKADSTTIIKRHVTIDNDKNKTTDQKISQIRQSMTIIQNTLSNPVLDEISNDLNQF